MAGDIYFNGSALAGGKNTKLNGTNMANVYFNGTKIWTAYIPSAQTYTSSSTYTIDDSETSIQWKISGGGGGGGGNLCTLGTQPGGAGGATTITVKDSSGNVRATLGTAAGGAGVEVVRVLLKVIQKILLYQTVLQIHRGQALFQMVDKLVVVKKIVRQVVLVIEEHMLQVLTLSIMMVMMLRSQLL